jgi:hypothetical protein
MRVDQMLPAGIPTIRVYHISPGHALGFKLIDIRVKKLVVLLSYSSIPHIGYLTKTIAVQVVVPPATLMVEESENLHMRTLWKRSNPDTMANYMRISSAARAPSAMRGVDRVHVPAPACMFSNGLPLPLAGGAVSSDPDPDDVEVKEAPGVGTGAEGWADGLGEEMVDFGVPSARVDVMMLPVLICVGPITIGTMICSVLPSLSVDVFVIVVLMELVKSSSTTSAWSSLWVVLVVGRGAAGFVAGTACVVACVVACGFGRGASLLDTASYAFSTASGGIVQPMASQYSSSGPRTSSMSHSSASHADTAHATALERYEALRSLV